MNRGTLILTTIRDCIAGDDYFTVLKIWNDQPKLKQVEVYPYLIKDTLDADFRYEDGATNGKRFVDIGLLIRWKGAKDIAGQGTQTDISTDIVSRLESVLASQSFPQSTTDGSVLHRIINWAASEWNGYFDEGRDYSEMLGIVTAFVITK